MSKLQERFFFLILILLSLLYLLFENDIIKQNEGLVKIEGYLREKPFISKYGGDVQRSMVVIKIKGNKSNYRIKGCGYSAADRDEILQLGEDDLVYLLVRDNSIHTRNKDVYVFGSGDDEYLSLSLYNKCEERHKSYLIPILIFFSFFFLYKILRSLTGASLAERDL
jgi:hypothetical protein